jgi:hypothetical protein
MQEDLIMNNRAYKCAVCNTWHKDIASRAKCEIACTEKKEEEERKAAEAKRAAEYEIRKQEVDAAFDNAYELRDKMLEDYGSYVYKRVTKNSDRYFPFSWLWE